MIYFVQAVGGGEIKIGTTGSLSKRLAQLEVLRGVKLKVIGVMKGSYPEERGLHARFSHLNTDGEWFRPETDLLIFISGNATPWDGKDEYVPVKIDSQAIFDARIAAAMNRMNLSVYLSGVVQEAALRDISAFHAAETDHRNTLPTG